MSGFELSYVGEPEPRTPDALFELIDDAIEQVLWHHRPVGDDSACLCGVVNNMDGDLLEGHQLGVLSEAVRKVLLQNMHEEQRTLADGMGGMSTNWKTGETTVHSRPCTRQSRWVTPWITS